MSLLDTYHQEHKARLARMNARAVPDKGLELRLGCSQKEGLRPVADQQIPFKAIDARINSDIAEFASIVRAIPGWPR